MHHLSEKVQSNAVRREKTLQNAAQVAKKANASWLVAGIVWPGGTGQ